MVEGSRWEKGHLKDLNVCWSIILERGYEIGWEGVDLIGVALDRDKWRALVNVVMNI